MQAILEGVISLLLNGRSRAGKEDPGVPLGGWQCSSAVARARQKSLQAMQERHHRQQQGGKGPPGMKKMYPEYTEVPDMFGIRRDDEEEDVDENDATGLRRAGLVVQPA